jgi:DNA-binding GntR family transcriptional regulator
MLGQGSKLLNRDPWGPLRKDWDDRRGQLTSEGSTADAVYHVLRGAIVENKLSAGLKLSEQVIADVLEVSRTPVREALQRLTSGRFIARDSQGSSRIQEMTRQRICDIYVVREVLEGLAARLAAQYSDRALVFELTQINQALRQATADSDTLRATDLNVEFHEALARGAHNDELLDLIHDTYGWVRKMTSSTLEYPGRAGTAADEHDEIIQAVAARDLNVAETLAKHHIGTSLQIRLAMLFGRSELEA